MSDKGGLHKAVDAAIMAKKLASIAKAAAMAGIKGAAIQAAKEFSPALIKAAIAILILLILIPFLIFAALPNIFFRYDGNNSNDITAMADKAKVIEDAYKSTQDYNEQEVRRVIESLSEGYDDVEVIEETGNLNHYWFIAICSVAYNQDLFAMNEHDIKNKTIFSYTCN